GDECHMAFHFPLMPRMYIALQMEDAFPIVDMLEQTPEIPETCQWATFLRNHDELTLEMVTDEERDYMYRVYARDPKARINMGIRRRLAPLLNNNRRKIELLNFLLFSLPGTPIIYYGDEIGMGDNYYLGDRNGVRTPMQWNSDKNAGFSKVNPQQLYLPVIIDPEYHYETVNVENQEKNLSSLLWWMRRIIAMRKKYKAFGRGSIKFIHSGNSKILSFIRSYNNEHLLVIINLSRFTQVGFLNLSEFYGYIPFELFGQQKFPIITEQEYTITMGPYDHFWLELQPDKKSLEIKTQSPEVFRLKSNAWQEIFNIYREYIEKEIMPDYLMTGRWFRAKTKKINRCQISEKMFFKLESSQVSLLFITLYYTEGEAETYCLPCTCTQGVYAERIKEQYTSAVILKFFLNEQECILYDAFYDSNFQAYLFSLIKDSQNLISENQLITLKGECFKSELKTNWDNIISSQILKTEQSNTSILFENRFFLKAFRKVENDINPEMEMNKFLTLKQFKNIPRFFGSITFKDEETNISSVFGILQEFIPSQGDAWTLTLNEIKLYFERVLARKNENPALPSIPTSFYQCGYSSSPELIQNLIGSFYAERAKLLGIHTAEMHISLLDSTDAAFSMEEFNLLYQRSIYQSIRVSVRKTISSLSDKIKSFDPNIRILAENIINNEKIFLAKIKKLLDIKIDCFRIRIHGDYHLGQLLYNGKDFYIIDFEGEPLRPIGERKLKKTAIRDIVGMVRSFQYAVYHTLYKSSTFREEDIVYLKNWGGVWYEYIFRYFIRGYFQKATNTQLLPESEEQFALIMEAFLIDKLFYEINYELNNRMDWIIIPLKGLTDLIEKGKKS
ncbi:MAG: hypothetical protein ACD_79C01427G0001, partial [uncultured bacterium]